MFFFFFTVLNFVNALGLRLSVYKFLLYNLSRSKI